MRTPRVSSFEPAWHGSAWAFANECVFPPLAVDEDFQASSSDGGSDEEDSGDEDSAMSDGSADKPAKKKQKKD